MSIVSTATRAILLLDHRHHPRPRLLRTKMAAAVVLAALFAALLPTAANAQAFSFNGVNATDPVIIQQVVNGTCQAGSRVTFTGNDTALRELRDAFSLQSKYKLAKSATTVNYSPGNLTIIELVSDNSICTKVGNKLEWLTPAYADAAYTLVYIGLESSIMGAAISYGGLSNAGTYGVELFSGCVAGAAGISTNNYILGIGSWQEIASGAVAGCITGALLVPGLHYGPAFMGRAFDIATRAVGNHVSSAVTTFKFMKSLDWSA